MNRRTLTVVFCLLSIGRIASASAINPFNSTGALGAFNPLSDVVFHTTDGTWTTGGITYSGGQIVTAGSGSGFESPYAVYNFTGITIAPGIRVTADQNMPLILLSTSTATINGIVDVSGQSGGAGFMGSGSASRSGAGGGGGAGGGVVGIFASTKVIVVSTGQILARGGNSGEGSNTSQTTGLGGAAGKGVAGGGSGGAGGSLDAGGAGGGGGAGAGNNGGGGGGGGGGAYSGTLGKKGGPNGTDGKAGGAGTPENLVAGGDGGAGGAGGNKKAKVGDGGSGGKPPATPAVKGGDSAFGAGAGGGGGGATNGQPGLKGGDAKGSYGGGGGGGGGGADCFYTPCTVGDGGSGGAGGGGASGGNGINPGIEGGKGTGIAPPKNNGNAGGGGAAVLGADDKKTVQIAAGALIDVTGGDNSRADDGVIVFLGLFEMPDPSGSIHGTFGQYADGLTADEFFAVGGGGGGAGAADGLPFAAPETSTSGLLGLGLTALVAYRARHRRE